MGEPFFFRCGEGVSVGLGEAPFFFLGDAVGDGDSSGVGDAFFFFGDADGDGDSSGAGEVFLFLDDAVGDGDSSGVGDFFFAAALVVFFFRCGVGVGVENIFLRA